MADGDMTVSITVTGTDTNGTAYNFSHSKLNSSVERVMHQKILVDSSSGSQLLSIFATEQGSVWSDIDGVFIRNLDSTNFVQVARQALGTSEYYTDRLYPGECIVYNNRSVDEGAGAFPSIISAGTLQSIEMKADTADVWVEVLVFRV